MFNLSYYVTPDRQQEGRGPPMYNTTSRDASVADANVHRLGHHEVTKMAWVTQMNEHSWRKGDVKGKQGKWGREQ